MTDLKPQLNLVDFARQYGPQDYQYDQAKLEPLCGDAGFRQYYRLTSIPSLMMADSPPEKERNFDMVRVSDLLNRAGVRTPKIHAVDFETGAFIIEDLGAYPLQDAVLEGDASEVYGKALDLLFLTQTHVRRPDWIEDYSAEFLREEMELFPEWFLEKLLGIKISRELSSLIESAFQRLIASALEQPQVFVHRDFHCRNLMMTKNKHPEFSQNTVKQKQKYVAAIDFQDAAWGPITYDLVSLARDCYLHWNPVDVEQLATRYAQRLVRNTTESSSVLNGADLTKDQLEKFPKWFDLMGLQRHLKVLGIFARLALRDDKQCYLNDLPLVLRYVIENLAKYPEFSELHQWFLTELIPAASRQEWYNDWQTAGQSVNQSIQFS